MAHKQWAEVECTDLLPSTWHLPEEQKSLTPEVFTSGPEDKGTPLKSPAWLYTLQG